MLQILKPPGFKLDELARTQEIIARKVLQRDGFRKLGTIASCDISSAEGDLAYAACAVLDCKSLELLDHRVAKVKLKFPYIPSFLAFRELGGMLKVLKGIDADVYMVGSHGLAHPRRAGLACHLGVTLDKPTLGVAKSRLYGDAETPPSKRGSYSFLKDDSEKIGAVLRTQTSVKPVYVSVGHKISLNSAVRITLKTTRRYRLPEPLRAAHQLASNAMREK